MLRYVATTPVTTSPEAPHGMVRVTRHGPDGFRAAADVPIRYPQRKPCRDHLRLAFPGDFLEGTPPHLKRIGSDAYGYTVTWAEIRWVRAQLCSDDADVTGHYDADALDVFPEVTDVRYWEDGAPGEDAPGDPLCLLALKRTPRGRWAPQPTDGSDLTVTDLRRRFYSPAEALAHFYPDAGRSGRPDG